MMRILKRAAVVFCSMIMFFIFCGRAIAEDINIGFTGPLTGPAAYIGIDSLHGALIAAKEVNDAGGVMVAGKKYTVKIHSYDDEGNAAKAAAGMLRLKDKYNVPVIWQGLSAGLFGMMEKNEKMDILLIGFYRHPDANKRGNKLLLRYTGTSRSESESLAKGAIKILNPKSVAIFADVADYGKGAAAVYREFFDKNGIKVVATEWMDVRTQTDFRGQLTKIKAAKPDVIMVTSYDEATAGVIKQAHELDIKIPFALSSGFQAMGEKLTGPALLEGYLKILEYQNKVPPHPAVERYRTKLYPAMNYKEPAGGYGPVVYATIHTIILAMQKAGTTTDAWKIREAAPTVIPLPERYATYGLQAWDVNGEATLEEPVGKYRNGVLAEVK